MVDSYDNDFWEPMGRRSRRYRNGPERRPDRGGSDEDTRSGGVILGVVSSLTAILVLAGLIYALGTGGRNQRALAAADCEPTLTINGLPCIDQRMENRKFEHTVNPSIRQLTREAAAYTADESHNLGAAEAVLAQEVTTETAFEQNLTAVMYTAVTRARFVADLTTAVSHGQLFPPPFSQIFTPQVTVKAEVLVRDIEAVAKLTAKQARSSSLRHMRSFNAAQRALAAVVLNEVKAIHNFIEVPILPNQEP
jgi:hypothetical protein